jgi:hypothetical protein
MKQKSDWKRITLLRKTSFKKEIKNIGRLWRQFAVNLSSRCAIGDSGTPKIMHRPQILSHRSGPQLPTNM